VHCGYDHTVQSQFNDLFVFVGRCKLLHWAHSKGERQQC